MTSQQILCLDAAGTPHEWIGLEKAIHYVVTDGVLWSVGDHAFTARGGTNARTGLRTTVAIPPIIAIKGATFASQAFHTPGPDRASVFRRDRMMCAYCGQIFREADLTLDHVVPQSRQGADSWTNLVAACHLCNHRKSARLPEEAGMPLLYLPYEPNRNEVFILTGRRVLADQMEWLRLGLPKHSRLRVDAIRH